MNESELTPALTKAKIGLMLCPNSVFITTILFSLKFSWTTSLPTAGTDGLNMFLNPDWFMGLKPEQRIGLLAHEAWHVAFKHMVRRTMRDPSRWNSAADYVINDMLVKSGMQIPDGGLVDSKYRNMSTEQVYDILEKENKTPNNNMPDLILLDANALPDKGAAGSGDRIHTNAKALDDAITDLLVKAKTQSKARGDQPGTVPGSIEVALQKLLHPKLPWNIILANYMFALAKNDFSFSRPNRRFMPDFHLPSAISEGLNHVASAVDASGSVSDMEFTRFLSELDFIKENMNPEKMTILDFDTKVHEVHKLNRDQNVASLSFHGRGGTNLNCVFEHFEKEGKPEVLIVFSDLYCGKIMKDPGYPVIWICVGNPKAEVEFGTLIHMEAKDV